MLMKFEKIFSSQGYQGKLGNDLMLSNWKETILTKTSGYFFSPNVLKSLRQSRIRKVIESNSILAWLQRSALKKIIVFLKDVSGSDVFEEGQQLLRSGRAHDAKLSGRGSEPNQVLPPSPPFSCVL